MVDPKETVTAGYDRVAARYAVLEPARAAWPRLRRLESLLAELEGRSRVLDVGCGNGIPTLAAIAQRHKATGVDCSVVQVEAARQNVPAATVLHGDIAVQEFPPESFDAVVAFYVVEHIPREEHDALFARFARWLRPGGHLLFTTERGDESGSFREWLDVPMFFSQFDEETTALLIESAGFDVLRREVESQLEEDSEVEYVWFHAKKRS